MICSCIKVCTRSMDAFGNEKIFMFLSIFTRSSDPWVVGHNLIGIVTSREEIPDLPKVGRNTEQFCYGSMDGV